MIVSQIILKLLLSDCYDPYPQLHRKIKLAVICGGLCTEILWRGYRFAMNHIKKSLGEAYIQLSNANASVLLNLSIF